MIMKRTSRRFHSKPKPYFRLHSVALLLLLALPLDHSNAAAVSTSHAKATEAAIRTLKKGGNAVDAMVAASFVLGVVQPYKMGIGGGGLFVLLTQDKTAVYDHREECPKNLDPKFLLDDSGKPKPRKEQITGPAPVGIPGTPAGLFLAHQKHGKLAWKTLLQPAIDIAEKGTVISEHFEDELKSNWERMKGFPSTAATFTDGEGAYLKRGRLLRQPFLALTLRKIADGGATAFYKGDLAKSWLSEAQKLGVQITAEDLANYKVRTAAPVQYKVYGFKAVTAPPPSTSGLIVAGASRFLDQYYKTHPVPAPDSAERIIATIEALKYFQKLRDDHLGDLNTSTLLPSEFLESDAEKKAWTEIAAEITKKLDRIRTEVGRASPNPKTVVAEVDSTSGVSHTAHLSIVDDAGNAVAYTTTIEAIFGSGMVVPKHGFLLNNELSDFDPNPDKPNSVAQGKRPRSNMSPTILFDKNAKGRQIPIAVVGAAGGLRIPTTVTEMLENYYVHKLSAEEAISFPRFHLKDEKTLEVEKGIPNKTIELLKEAGYDVVPKENMWSVAAILSRRSAKEKWEAASEIRYDGVAWNTD